MKIKSSTARTNLGKLLLSLAVIAGVPAMAQNCPTCGVASLSLPTNGLVTGSQSFGNGSSNSSYLVFGTQSVPVGSSLQANTNYPAWCVDQPDTPIDAVPYAFMYSTLDPALNSVLGNSNYFRVNWVLNNRTGSPKDVQQVIWMLLFGPNVVTPSPATPEAMALYTSAMAVTSFTPGPGQIIGVVMTQDGAGGTQDTMIEVRIPDCGTIGDYVWRDTNTNGYQDASETGIENVKVTLTPVSVPTNPQMQPLVQYTGVNGSYKFTGLCAGSYTVAVDTPAGTTPTGTCTAGGSCTTLTDSNTTPAQVTIPTAGSDLTIDFGFKPVAESCTAKIGNTVWRDKDGDGLQDVGEPGLANVKVQLFANGNTTPLQTVTTDCNGNYTFTALCSGTYIVKPVASTIPTGLLPTAANIGTDRAADSNGATDGSGASVTLGSSGATDNTIDFGYKASSPVCTASLGSFVWNDLNRNGLQDVGEPGIANVTMILKDINGKVIATTITDINGNYSFTGLCAGSFNVYVDTKTLPAGYTKTNSPKGADTTKDSNSLPACIRLTNGQSDTTIDFGFAASCNSTVGNRVWFDSDSDGLQDSIEVGIAGVTVRLRKATDNSILATTTTDNNGYYKFYCVCAGNYKVEVVPPSTVPGSNRGVTLTTPNASGTNSDNDSNLNPATVTVGSNVNITNVDFGFKPNTTQATGCTYSWGYWKNHDEKWPTSCLSIGYKTYSRSELLAILRKSVSGDASLQLAHQLIAAKLNMLAGAILPKEVQTWMQTADEVLKNYGKLPCGTSNSTMTYLADKLEAYNTGTMSGVRHCDENDKCDNGYDSKYSSGWWW